MATFETYNIPTQPKSPETLVPSNCRYAYHIVIPESSKVSRTPLRVLIWGHGSIDSEDYQRIVQDTTVDALELVPFCEKHNIVAIVPVLPRKKSTAENPPLDAQTFNRATMLRNIDPFYNRPDVDILLATQHIMTELTKQGHTIADKLIVGGISAGGTMANRFAFLYPDLISAVIMLKAGAFSLPANLAEGVRLPYPYGSADIYQIAGNTHSSKAYERIPMFVYVGEQDQTFPREELNIGGSISLEDVLKFGKTPLDRMSYFAHFMEQKGGVVKIEIGRGLGHKLGSNTLDNAFQFIEKYTKK